MTSIRLTELAIDGGRGGETEFVQPETGADDDLCADLEPQCSMIVEAILAGLADPATLAELLPEQDAPDADPDGES